VDPVFVDPAYANWHIQPDSPCVDAGDNDYVLGDLDIDGEPRVQPAGGTVDIGADESDGTAWPAGPYVIVRVSTDGDDENDGSSWSLAKRTVQAAIDVTSEFGGEVWVAAGTYYERITLLPYAYVYGGFSGCETERDQRDWVSSVTILDGQQEGSVVTARLGHGVSALDGFTVANGHADCGGGVFLEESSPTISNNTITGNSADWSGGGLCLYYYSSPTIVNNTIVGNSATRDGGGLWLNWSYPTIANSTIAGNSAQNGGGLYTASFPIRRSLTRSSRSTRRAFICTTVTCRF
jgi:parallel beta-helix repeat protein